MQNPGRKNAPRERGRLFVWLSMVSFAARDARPHPEERGCRKGPANSHARTRVSKDEDVRLGLPSCFETHRSGFGLWKRLRSRRAATLLSMRARGRRAFWPNEAKDHFAIRSSPRGAPRDARVAGTPLRGPMITAGGYGSRLSLRSAGTTIAWSARRINLRLCEMAAGAISLFPIDINNGNCNSNVFDLRGPYHPHMSPTMWHHPS